MAIRHWHPIKLGIVWLIDLALFLSLSLEVSNEGGSQVMVIIIWLILSIPVFIVTWKWASRREQEEQLKKNDISPPAEQVGKEREYRISTLRVSRYKFDQLKLDPRDFVKGFVESHEEIEGWELISVCPIEKESDEEWVTIVALIAR